MSTNSVRRQTSDKIYADDLWSMTSIWRLSVLETVHTDKKKQQQIYGYGYFFLRRSTPLMLLHRLMFDDLHWIPVVSWGTGRYSDSRYSDKCFRKGATNTNSNPNRNLNPNTNPDPNPNPYPFRNVGIAAVGIATASQFHRRAIMCCLSQRS